MRRHLRNMLRARQHRRDPVAMAFPSWLPLLLGVLTAVGPISTDMYLPAFPAIESALGGVPGSAQMTLATWFMGLAIGQISQGSLSDRYGRRLPLIIGTVVYTVASAGCALAPDLVSLSAFRFLAAVGGSASMVIPRAMVRDLADGHAAARLMSRLMLVMGAAPILAPTLGGLVLSVGSWRTIFWFATVYGVVCCVVVSLVLPDTLPARKRVRLGAYAQLARYGMIIRERGFITHAMMGGFAMFAMFAYIGGAPPVFIERFGFSPPEFGALFGCCAFGLILASQINPLVLPRFGANRLMRVAVRTAFAATLVLLVVALSAWGGWLATAAPIAVVVASQGFTNPNATVGALSRHAAHAGMASALMGTLQFLIGAISGVLVGLLDDGTARPLAFLMVLGMAGAVLCDYFRPRPT